MKHKLYLSAIFFSLLFASCGTEKKQISDETLSETASYLEQLVFSNEIDSVSYALGLNVGNQLTNTPQEQKFNFSILVQAVMDIKNGEARMTMDNAKIHMQAFQQSIGKDAASKVDSASYAVGLNVGNQLGSAPQNFNLDFIAQAIKDLELGKAKMAMDEAAMFLQAFQEREIQAMMEKNGEEGKRFLDENKSDKGVITLPSGLQYKIITEGTGPKPKATDNVEVHYKGTLIDGREFDSSYTRGETITFALNQVIKGWTEGLQQIKEGSTVMLYVPQDLAYGANPMPGGIIEPGMTLIFEIELIKVTPQN